MKTIGVWTVVLTSAVIVAVYVGERITSDAAAVIVGAGLGLAGAVAATVIWMTAEDVRRRQGDRRRAREARRGLGIVEGEWWYDLPAAPAADRRRDEIAGRPEVPAVEAPGRTLVVHER